MSSQRKAALRPIQPAFVAGGSAGESSGSGQTTSSGTSDGMAEENRGQSSSQPHVSTHGAQTSARVLSCQTRRTHIPTGVNPAAFALPCPPQHKVPAPFNVVAPKHVRKETPLDLVTRVSQQLPPEPKPSADPPTTDLLQQIIYPHGRMDPPCDVGTRGSACFAAKIFSMHGPQYIPLWLHEIKEPSSTVACADNPTDIPTIFPSDFDAPAIHSSDFDIDTEVQLFYAEAKTQLFWEQAEAQLEEEKLYITIVPEHHVGLPWKPLPIEPIPMPVLPPPSTDLQRAQYTWLLTLHKSSSVEDVWNAYTSLDEHDVPISFSLIHRTVRVVSRHNAKVYVMYTRLLALLRRLRDVGGTIHPHEWNALIHAAGSGMRKTSVRHYETALSIFRDMTKGRAPGTTLELDQGVRSNTDVVTVERVEPDVFTYTTLIGIAAKIDDPKCMRHARTLMERSGIPPNRFTHLALIPYFSATHQLGAVRSTVLRLERDKMELGLDGLNALLWAYHTNKRLEITMMIYRLLRHNLAPGVDIDEEDTKLLDSFRRQLKLEEFIVVPDYLVPNQVTYTTMIQFMAYHGHLSTSLTIFAEMLSTSNTELGAPLVRDEDGSLKPTYYQPTIAVFRALFLGFRRHARKKNELVTPKTDRSNQPGWTLDNLQQLFDSFMRMPTGIQMNRTIFFWIITAFKAASNDDVELVRDVWKRIEGRFKGSFGGHENRLRRMHASLFPEEVSSVPERRRGTGKGKYIHNKI
ncbi:hypothetical protein H0H87_004241 [Tephrocybe sp. NHM501043]|nr:hypothetical protein H0H87_004241 [Tephrocybe sp. NHM501043]